MHIFHTNEENTYRRQGLFKELVFTDEARVKYERAIETQGQEDVNMEIKVDAENGRLLMIPTDKFKLTIITDCIGITALQSATVKIYPISSELMFVEVLDGCILLRDKENENVVYPLDLSNTVAGKRLVLNEIKWLTAKDFMKTFDGRLSERWGLGEGKYRYDYCYTVLFEMSVSRVNNLTSSSFNTKILADAEDLTGGKVEALVTLEYTKKNMRLMERNRELASLMAFEEEQEEYYLDDEDEEYNEEEEESTEWVM